MKRLFTKIFRALLLISCKLVTGIQPRWLGEPSNQVRVYYANHSSHLDGIVLWSCFPKYLRKKLHPVAARDYWAKNQFKLFIAQDIFNSILINRTPTRCDNPIKTLKETLSKDHSLIIFPEGTRGTGKNIADFKSGLFYLAKHFPHVEIVSVYLNNLNRVLPKGAKLLVPIICSAVFGSPIEPLQEHENKSTFLLRAKQALEELVA